MKFDFVIILIILPVLGSVNSFERRLPQGLNFTNPLGNLAGNLRNEAEDLFSESCEDLDDQITKGRIDPRCFRSPLSPAQRPVSVDLAALLFDKLDDPGALQNILKSVGTNRNTSLDMIDHIRSKGENLSQLKMKSAVGPLVESLGGAENLRPSDMAAFGSSLLEKMPGGFIKKLSQDSFDAFLEEVFVNTEKRPQEVLTSSEGHAVCEKTFRLYRTIETVEEFDKILPVLLCAPTEFCRNIPTSIVVSRLANLTHLPWNCESNVDENDDSEKLKDQFPQMAGCAKILVHKAVSSSFDSNMFNSLGSFKKCLNGNDLKALVSSANCSDILNIGRSVDLSKFGRVKKRLRQRCAPPALSQPGNLTAENLVSMGSMAMDLPKRSLRRLSTEALCDPSFVGAVKNSLNPPTRTRQTIAKRCYKNRTLTVDDVSTMGSDILLNLDVKQLRNSGRELFQSQESKRALKKALAFGRNNPRIKLLRRTMQDKLNVSDMVDSPSIMKELPLSRMESDVVDIRHDLGLDNNETSIDLPDAKNRWGVRKWLTQTSLQNITADELRGMKSVARGFLSSQISQLNSEDPLTSASVLCDQENWPSKTVRAITREMIVPYFRTNEDSTDFLSSFSLTDVTVIGPECLMQFQPDEIKEASTEVCLAICEKIGSSNQLLKFPSEKRTFFKDMCLRCLGKSDTSTTITEEDLDVLGHVLVAELTEELSRVDPTGFKNKVDLFRQGCLKEQSLTNIRPLIESAFGAASSMDSTTILQMGDLVRSLAQDGSLAEVNANALYEAAEEVLQDLEPTDEKKLFIRDNCLNGLSSSEQLHQDELKRSIMESLVVAFDSGLSERKRRKRSGSLWTCDDITSMGASIVGASVEDLNAIDNSEFYDCFGQMSQYSNWEVSKRDALLQKFKDGVSQVCNLTSADLVSLGHFSLSFTEVDIECIPMVEDDPVATLGFFHTWTDVQIRALAHRYMQERDVTVGDLTDMDLSTLGHIICGFHAQELEMLTSSAFIGSSAQIGLLQSCGSERLLVLKTIASRTDTFGAISNWNVEIFSELGIIVGGFSTEELSGLTLESIEGIQPHGISNMPGSTLMAFSIEQFGSFSLEQALAVTETQKESLSSEQLSAIGSALGGQQGNSLSLNSASTHPAGIMMLILMSFILSGLQQ